MKVLIAGKGFIGEQVGEKIDGEVKYLSRETGDYRQDITKEFEIEEKFDALIHTVGLEPGTKSREAYEAVHVNGTENLLNAVEADKVVYISALGVGKVDHPYMETKSRAEEIVKKEENWTIVRPSIVYGEKNGMMEKLSKVMPVGIFPRVDVRMQPIHVEDLTEILVETVQKYDGEILEVGGPDKLYIYEMFRNYFEQQEKKFYSFPMPLFIPKTGIRLLSRPPTGIPELSKYNANLLTDNVIEGENDGERILGELRTIRG